MHRWSCFWFLIAAQSLSDRRLWLWRAEAAREALDPNDPAYELLRESDDALVAKREARVNRALLVRNKYKKRACEKCRSAVQRLEA